MESLLSWPTKDAAEYKRTDIVRWWEARRLRFNFYVGAVGVVTWLLVMIAGSAAVKPGEDFEEPLVMMYMLSWRTFATRSVGLRIPLRLRAVHESAFTKREWFFP